MRCGPPRGRAPLPGPPGTGSAATRRRRGPAGAPTRSPHRRGAHNRADSVLAGPSGAALQQQHRQLVHPGDAPVAAGCSTLQPHRHPRARVQRGDALVDVTAYRRTASRACSSSPSSSRSPDASGGRLFAATAHAVAAHTRAVSSPPVPPPRPRPPARPCHSANALTPCAPGTGADDAAPPRPRARPERPPAAARGCALPCRPSPPPRPGTGQGPSPEASADTPVAVTDDGREVRRGPLPVRPPGPCRPRPGGSATRRSPPPLSSRPAAQRTVWCSEAELAPLVSQTRRQGSASVGASRQARTRRPSAGRHQTPADIAPGSAARRERRLLRRPLGRRLWQATRPRSAPTVASRRDPGAPRGEERALPLSR